MTPERTEDVMGSLNGRVPKTVFSRLMLEKQDLTTIKRLLTRYHACIPCHWYIATRANIKSAEIKPRIAAEGGKNSQLKLCDIPERTHCHTNHFQRGASSWWSWSKNEQDESKKRLETLRRFARSVGVYRNANLCMTTLREPLERLRVCMRKQSTSATIILGVSRSETRVETFDHFEGKTVHVGLETIPA
jgi:hypothetical protein